MATKTKKDQTGKDSSGLEVEDQLKHDFGDVALKEKSEDTFEDLHRKISPWIKRDDDGRLLYSGEYVRSLYQLKLIDLRAKIYKEELEAMSFWYVFFHPFKYFSLLGKINEIRSSTVWMSCPQIAKHEISGFFHGYRTTKQEAALYFKFCVRILGSSSEGVDKLEYFVDLADKYTTRLAEIQMKNEREALRGDEEINKVAENIVAREKLSQLAQKIKNNNGIDIEN